MYTHKLRKVKKTKSHYIRTNTNTNTNTKTKTKTNTKNKKSKFTKYKQHNVLYGGSI